MINVKETIRTILTGGTITALVPATSIRMAWPDVSTTFPAITYYEVDNFAGERFDNLPIADNCTVAIDLWDTKSLTTIFFAVDAAMEAAGWNRISAPDLYETDTKIHHKALRYENILYRT